MAVVGCFLGREERPVGFVHKNVGRKYMLKNTGTLLWEPFPLSALLSRS